MKRVIFFHIWKSGRWRELVALQLRHLLISGLYDAVDSIQVHANGPQDGLDTVLSGYDKIIIGSDSNKETFELTTLSNLRLYCIQNPNDYVYYMHTKGLSRCWQTVDQWRVAMEHFTIGYYQLCLDLLDAGADMVGINLFPGPVVHYSGNFWWAKAQYIASLPEIQSSDRMEAEFWPVSGTGQFECLHYTKVDHYTQAYPLEWYKDIDVIKSYREATYTRQKIWTEHGLSLLPILDNFK